MLRKEEECDWKKFNQKNRSFNDANISLGEIHILDEPVIFHIFSENLDIFVLVE